MDELIDAIYTPVEFFKEMRSKVKCPHCGKNHYKVDYITETRMHLPTIFKDGICISGDDNVTTTYCTCMNCGKKFSS